MLQINVTNEIDYLLCLCYASSTSVLCSAYDMPRIIHALICTMIFALETDICMMQMLLLNTLIKVILFDYLCHIVFKLYNLKYSISKQF